MTKKHSDYIKQYSVQIKSSFGKDGSGILIKTNDTIYLATATHNFTNKEGKNTWRYADRDIKKSKIKFNEIQVLNQDKKACDIQKLIYLYEDFIIFEVRSYLKLIDNIEVLEKNSISDSLKYFFHGYSAEEGEGYIDGLGSRNDIGDNKYKLTDSTQRRMTYVKGFSGSGVFVKINEVYYLTGILLEKSDEASSYTIFNIAEIIGIINEKIKDSNLVPIRIGESNFHLKEIDEMYDWIASYHKNNFLIEQSKKVFGENHTYLDLIQPPNKLEKLNRYMDLSNQFAILEDEYTQELADMYLFGAFISSKYGEKEKALNYLMKAQQFRPEYAFFLAEIDKENSKEALFKLAKVAYVDKKYDDSYKCFQKILSLKLEKDEKIEVYEYLVKISTKMDYRNKLISYYYKLSELYESDIKKAKIYYKLSKIEESKEKKIFFANQGIRMIYYSYNEIEMKYLLYKRLYELTEEKYLYSILKSNLEELIKIEPQYKYELSTLNYSETLKKIGWGTYISLITLLLLLLVFGRLEFLYLNKLVMPISIFLFTITQFRWKMDTLLLWMNIIILFGSLLYSIYLIYLSIS
jgi:hypothetical protein